MSSTFIDYFDTNISILKWAGMWIPEKSTPIRTKVAYGFYNTFWMFYSVLLYTTSEVVVLTDTVANIDDLVKNLNMALTHLLATIKLMIWFRNRDDIINIIDTLRNASASYEPIGDFQPEVITHREKREKDIWSKVFLTMGCCVSVTACLNCLLWAWTTPEEAFLHVSPNNSTNTLEEHSYGVARLPYFSYIPWDYRKSKTAYCAAVLYQFFPVFNMAYIIIGFDTLFTTIISYTSSQLLILQGAFRTIRERCLKRLGITNETTGRTDFLHDPDELAEETNNELKRCIKHLQIIFDVCERVENIFTYITLAQVLISLFVLCTCLYLVSSYSITSQKFCVEMVYLIAIEIQLGLYCYFGNKVTQRGENVIFAIYDGDWFSATQSFKQTMLITMTRMRRPILFTIGKFTPLTLSTFVTISRGSYSFFAVLKKSNSNE